MKSGCISRPVRAYNYPFPRVACKAPASVITDTEGVGATPENLIKSALFNLWSPLVIVVESLAAWGLSYASLNTLIWHEIRIERHIAVLALMWRTCVPACCALLDTGQCTWRLCRNSIMAGGAVIAWGGLASKIFSRVGPLFARGLIVKLKWEVYGETLHTFPKLDLWSQPSLIY